VLHKQSKNLLPIGMLTLSAGLLLHNWRHGRSAELAEGLLIGMSVVFIIAGWLRRSRQVN